MTAGTGDDRFAELRRDVRFQRERLDLYKAKIMGPRPTSMARLRELEHEYRRAQERLDHALSEQPQTNSKEPA